MTTKYFIRKTQDMPDLIVRDSDKASITRNMDDFNYTDYLQWLSDGNIPDVVSDPVTVVYFKPGDLIDSMTDTELATIMPIVEQDLRKRWLFTGYAEVRTDDPRFVSALTELIQAGIITQERATELIRLAVEKGK